MRPWHARACACPRARRRGAVITHTWRHAAVAVRHPTPEAENGTLGRSWRVLAGQSGTVRKVDQGSAALAAASGCSLGHRG